MATGGKPGVKGGERKDPNRRRYLLGGAGVLGLILCTSLLTATSRQIPPAPNPAKARTLVAHSDCLRQCHQAHPKPLMTIVPTPKGQTALLQGPINTVCLSCHQGPPAP